MTTRILPKEEWPRLRGTDAETVWPSLDPSRSVVVVVEDEGVIVAHHILLFVLHAEAIWVHPDHRGKTSAARRLWGAVRSAVIASGSRGFVTAACDDHVRELLAHVGAVALPDHYVVSVEK